MNSSTKEIVSPLDQLASLKSSIQITNPPIENPLITKPKTTSLKNSPEKKPISNKNSPNFPLKRTNTKSSLKKSKVDSLSKFQRQYTFITKKKKGFFEDDNNSSEKSLNEDPLEDIPKYKKPQKPEIYDALMQKVPRNHLKIIKETNFSTTIDTNVFSLKLKKQNDDTKMETLQNNSHSQPRVRSGSIIDNVMKHLLGKDKEHDSKFPLKKQMSMRFPSNQARENHEKDFSNKNRRKSLFGFFKTNNNNHTNNNNNIIDNSNNMHISINKNQEEIEENQINEIKGSSITITAKQMATDQIPMQKRENRHLSTNFNMKSSRDSQSPRKNIEGSPSIDQHLKEMQEKSPLTKDEEQKNEEISAKLQKLNQMDEMIQEKNLSAIISTNDDFTLEDFMILKKEIEREKKILEEEIKNVTLNKYTNVEMKLKGKFVEKWTRAKWNIKAAAKMRRLNDDIKLYGSSFNVTGIQQKMEKLQDLFVRQKTLTEKFEKSYVFLPESPVRIYWSYVVIFLLIYTSYITPYRIAFMDSSITYDSWFFVESTVDVLFFIDILITLNSAYRDTKGKLVTNRCQIFIAYLKTWLLLDILGIFPFSFIEEYMNSSGDSESQFDNYNDLLKFMRLPRLYRLIRIARLFKFIKKAKKMKFIEAIKDFFQLNAGSVKIMQFLFTMSICVHIIGCLWVFIAKIRNFPPSTWVAK